MTCGKAVRSILCGRCRHFRGNEYEVNGIARHSETTEPVVCRVLCIDAG